MSHLKSISKRPIPAVGGPGFFSCTVCTQYKVNDKGMSQSEAASECETKGKC
jgi:hypothetical protein